MEFFIKIKFFISFFLLIITTSSLNAQDSGSYWQIDYAKGSIIKHTDLVGFLFKKHPTLLSIGWHKKAQNLADWKQRYNYLDWGFVMHFQEFHNPDLGRSIGLNYTTTYYLLNRNIKNQFNIQLGFGGGYNSTPLDFEENLKNIVMSTSFLFSQHIKINYTHPYLFGKTGIHTGITFTHFSNGGFKKPNLGLNTIFFNFGFNYHNTKPLLYDRFKKRKKEVTKLITKKYHLTASLGGGYNETLPNIGLKPIYYASIQFSRKVNIKNGFHLGFDFFNSQSLKDLAAYLVVEKPNEKAKDHKQLAFYVGHELYFNTLSFESKVGYYLYNPTKGKMPVYEIVSFKRYFKNKKSALSVNLKTHFFEAEHITLGYHHQIF